jgi:hypothetical protein
VASIELFGSVLPQILFFVQSRTERIDRLFTCGFEWMAQFPVGFAWHKLLRHAVFEPLMKPETLAPGVRRTYDLGLTMASLLPVTGFVYYLTSLRNTLRAKVLHQNSYVGAIGLDKKVGAPREKITKEDEQATAQKNWDVFYHGQQTFLALGLAAIPVTYVFTKAKPTALPEINWKLALSLPELPAMGGWYQNLKAFAAKGVDVKPIDFFLTKGGDISQLSPVQEAVSVGAPSYAGYLRFAQDKLEVGDIVPRIVTYAFSVPFGPSSVLNQPWAKQAFEGKQYPVIGDGKNAQLLMRLGLSCLVYTGLPQAYTLLTRQKRAEKAGLLPTRQESLLPSAEPQKTSPLQGVGGLVAEPQTPYASTAIQKPQALRMPTSPTPFSMLKV